VTACGMIGPAAKTCIPHLPKRLVDRSLAAQPWLEQAERALVERAAAWTCGRMGKLAAVHIDRLISVMQANPPQPTEFVDAIAEIGQSRTMWFRTLWTSWRRPSSAGTREAVPRRRQLQAALRAGAGAVRREIGRSAPLLDRFLREKTFWRCEDQPEHSADHEEHRPGCEGFRSHIEAVAGMADHRGAKPDEVAEMKTAAQAALEAVAGKDAGPGKGGEMNANPRKWPRWRCWRSACCSAQSASPPRAFPSPTRRHAPSGRTFRVHREAIGPIRRIGQI